MGMSATILSACSTPPKPKELTELERILQAPDALEVRDAPGAGKYYREARQYRRVARKAYEQEELERAREYAILGTLRYRTAAAIKKQLEEKKRLDAANAQVASINPELKALNQERNKLVKEVGLVERQVAQARNAQAQLKRRRKAQQGGSLDRNANTSSAERLAAGNKIAEAKEARDAALRVKADEFAEGAFNRANNQLNSAAALYSSNAGSPDAVVQSADRAAELFRQAAQAAMPQYNEYLAMQKPDARRAELRTEARNTFGAPFAMREPLGVRVILAMAFEEGSSRVRPASQALISSVVDLAKKYENAELVIEGYTRKGNATENLATSALRARNVRDAFVSQGIDDDRITTSGQGQSALRYPDDPSKNDRVEVIFRIPD
jgi:outer membrane protein OmpA-like peptidoglycan-associated protein